MMITVHRHYITQALCAIIKDLHAIAPARKTAALSLNFILDKFGLRTIKLDFFTITVVSKVMTLNLLAFNGAYNYSYSVIDFNACGMMHRPSVRVCTMYTLRCIIQFLCNNL